KVKAIVGLLSSSFCALVLGLEDSNKPQTDVNNKKAKTLDVYFITCIVFYLIRSIYFLQVFDLKNLQQKTLKLIWQ
ncbi:MAG TPA: hypothetical protein PLE32_23105, partial [Haliscomenobacter sp.]|nr:hypothetical protein [Haliscomenobacter sp.]